MARAPIALERPLPAAAGPPPSPVQPAVRETVPDTLLQGLGGFGHQVAHFTRALSLAQGAELALATLDNAASIPAPVRLPGGEEVPFPADRRLQLGRQDNLSAAWQDPLLRQRYFASGLLRGTRGALAQAAGGHGGGSVPIRSLIDEDCEVAAVRAHRRQALTAAARPRAAGGGPLAQLYARRRNGQARLFTPVVSSGTGSFGAGTCLLEGYFLLDDAARLGLPEPERWLFLAGPRAFTGLTRRIEVNFYAVLLALRHLASHGVERPLSDGTTLSSPNPPYDRIWLLDDPTLPADGQRVTEAELEAFAWRVAGAIHAFLQPQVRAAYLDHVRNFDEQPWPGFGVLQFGAGGFERRALARPLATQLALAQARCLERSLGNGG